MFEHVGIEAKESNSKVLAALAYVPVSPINIIVIAYVLLTQKDDKYARYHAMQSGIIILAMLAVMAVLGVALFMITFAAATVGADFVGILWFLPMCLGFGVLLLEIYFVYLAYTGVAFKLPMISDIAQKHA